MGIVQHVLNFHISVSCNRQGIWQDQASSIVDNVSLYLFDFCCESICHNCPSNSLRGPKLFLLEVVAIVDIFYRFVFILWRQKGITLAPTIRTAEALRLKLLLATLALGPEAGYFRKWV